MPHSPAPLQDAAGFISQSVLRRTAISTGVCRNVGFSSFVSIGSMLDVDWSDLIYYLGDDPHTKSIVIYMETIGNARALLRSPRSSDDKTDHCHQARPHRRRSKGCRIPYRFVDRAVDEVLEVAFRRASLRVNSIGELFYMAEAPQTTRPCWATTHHSYQRWWPCVLATDALITDGGELAKISPETMEEFNKLLPAAWSHNNPVDILGDASPERLRQGA
ncbi:MAG: hypothetical protein U0Z26_19155 [Anaerolineales bacterium]